MSSQEGEAVLSKEMNERLTRVGPGTPLGALLRRYWYPVARVADLDESPVMPVGLLGEEFALYRTNSGTFGLVARRCPHRGASLAHGLPDEDGLRCANHGWRFDTQGQCTDMPTEPGDASCLAGVQVAAFPVQVLGGLVWTYIGPAPVPLLPRWDILVRDDLDRSIGVTHLPINFLQAMENSMDPVHFEWLHAVYGNYVRKRQGKPPSMTPRKHEQIAFDIFEYGIYKRRLLEGENPETSDDWTTGHPVLFPYILAVGDHSRPSFQIRVPVDDTHTLHYWYRATPRTPGQPVQERVPTWDEPYVHPSGRLVVETIPGQDMMAWVTQGEISDRTTERLGASDKGIILYRNLLLEQMQKVERGEDPMGVIRDPAKNEPHIVIGREHVTLRALNIQRDVINQEAQALGLPRR
ncbi:MAG TPA: Rieske 2Fe-2S domain-containing protein [Chloroflexota bacterium]|nr:Rieske 2Fe-2S domain-containing protein [Chloroflexota bacterium]